MAGIQEFSGSSKYPIRYTADNQPVRVIYVSQLERCPFPVNQRSLQDFFNRAGPVEKVSIVKKFDHTFAFVTFRNAEDASKVLADKTFKQKKMMSVRMADSWHQPKASEEINYSSNDYYGLLTLNDDCLFHILSFLNPTDAVNLAETDDRILEVAKMHFKKYSNFNCDTVVTPAREEEKFFRRFYRHVGPYIKTLIFSEDTHILSAARMLSIFSKFCCNVEDLQLHSVSSLIPNVMHRRFFAAIKKLELRECYIDDRVMMKIFIPSTSQLEHLEFHDCDSITGKCLQKFSKLKFLKFTACSELCDDDIEKGLQNNPDLKELTLIGSGVTLDEISTKHIQNLDKLEIDIAYSFKNMLELDKLCRLNRLTKLNLLCRSALCIDTFLTKLGKKDILEELTIHQLNINESTLTAFESFKKLKVLNLASPVNGIDDKFFKRLPLVLPELKSFAYKSNGITIDNVLMIVKNLNLLEFIDISALGAVTQEQIEKIIDLLKKDWKRPLLRVVVSDFIDLFNSKWYKEPFMIGDKCIMELSIKNGSDDSSLDDRYSDLDSLDYDSDSDSFGFGYSDYEDYEDNDEAFHMFFFGNMF